MPPSTPGNLLKPKFRTVHKAASPGLTIALFPAVAAAGQTSPLDPVAKLQTVILWIAAVILATVGGLLIYSLVRFRRTTTDDPGSDHTFQGSTVLETIWTIIPVAILLVILVLTFQTIRDTEPERETDRSGRGELLLETNCSSCHVINGKGGQVGPELTNVYAAQGEDYVWESILMPNALITPACPTRPCPSGVMPQNFGEQLTADEMNSIVSYLREVAAVESN
jgi:heme/copper-type cytochrome/quinol oxidase subunit 2